MGTPLTLRDALIFLLSVAVVISFVHNQWQMYIELKLQKKNS